MHRLTIVLIVMSGAILLFTAFGSWAIHALVCRVSRFFGDRQRFNSVLKAFVVMCGLFLLITYFWAGIVVFLALIYFDRRHRWGRDLERETFLRRVIKRQGRIIDRQKRMLKARKEVDRHG